MPQEPRLLRSDMTGRIYVVTKYRDLGEGRFEAITKHDVTEEFDAILAAIRAKAT